MEDEQITASWFTDGWAEAYHVRASRYGEIMPPDEHRRMMYADKRMCISQKREDEQRIAAGKEPIWNTIYGYGGVESLSRC